MTKYKVGDIVKIREDLEVGRYYGRQCVNKSMAEDRGKIVKIENILSEGYILPISPYSWTDEMFEGIATKYKVGDKVRIREDLRAEEYYDNCYVNPTMASKRGKIMTVNKVSILSNTVIRYRLQEENEYYWSDKMFEDIVLEERDSITIDNCSQTGCDKQDSDDRFMPTVVQTGFRFL